MLRKIYRELVAIRKELQAIRSSLELRSDKPYTARKISSGTMKANFIRDEVPENHF